MQMEWGVAITGRLSYENIPFQSDRQTDRQTDTFIEPICYRFLIETNIIKGKETLAKTLQSLSWEPPLLQ